MGVADVIDSRVPPREREIMPPRKLTYREIADDITDRIRAGEPGYQPGDELPSYTGFAALYSVSVSTASRALGLLHDRGLVESIVGRATYVRAHQPPSGSSSPK